MPTKKELEEQVKYLQQELENAKKTTATRVQTTGELPFEDKQIEYEEAVTDIDFKEIESELSELLKELKSFTKEYPMMSMVGAGLLGILIGRLVSK
ncbi:MAG: hypothetical protein ACK5LE_03865 [Alphaproteobacteria bacterium]